MHHRDLDGIHAVSDAGPGTALKHAPFDCRLEHQAHAHEIRIGLETK
jgi:hypothetical protein